MNSDWSRGSFIAMDTKLMPDHLTAVSEEEKGASGPTVAAVMRVCLFFVFFLSCFVRMSLCALNMSHFHVLVQVLCGGAQKKNKPKLFSSLSLVVIICFRNK